MDTIAPFLTELAIDPFKREDYIANRDSLLAAAGVSPDSLASAISANDGDDAVRIAGGPWAACQTCSDPGKDDFPESDGSTGTD